MLVLTRRLGEELHIKVGDIIIKVTVTRMHDNRVRIGIDAPKEAQVSRPDQKKGIKQ